MEHQRYVVGIDLGGTKIRIGVVATTGELLQAETWPTLAEQGPDAVLSRIGDGVREVIQRARVAPRSLMSAGIGAPGLIDVSRGIVSVMPNLPGWRQFPLRARLEEALGVSVALGNDANVGALGEHRFGAGRGTRDMVYVAIGTGVGGGIIVNNQLCGGATGAAGELGHIILDPKGPVCNCGRRGCLEAYCSGRSLERLAAQAIAEGRASIMPEIASDEAGAITTRVIQAAARRGDLLAQELLSQGATYLGWGLVSLVHIFNPELVVFGGGMVALADSIIEPAIALVREQAFEQDQEGLRFAFAELGEDVAVLGAAALAIDALPGSRG